MKNKNNSWPEKVINFLGWFILLVGIYAVIKTTYNHLYLKNNYPLTPVINLNIFSYPDFEENCYQQFSYPYYDDKGKPRPPFKEEKEMQEKNLKICLERIKKQREQTKQNDVWISFMLVFLGGGILYTKRFYLKES
jgi:hypothetical protein